MAAQDKIETGLVVIMDDVGGTARDVTGDLVPGSLSGFGYTYDTADMTSVADRVKNAFATWATSDISFQLHMNDTATTGSTTIINGYTPALINTALTLTVQLGSAGAAPVTGDYEWEGEYIMTANTIAVSGNAIYSVSFSPDPRSSAPAPGTVA